MATENKTSEKRQRLLNLMRGMFQLDQPDLDFGLYRIMHAKRKQVEAFLGTEFDQLIDQVFSSRGARHEAEAKKEYEVARQQAVEFGAPDPEVAPKVQQARARYDVVRLSGGEDAEIYDHLHRFFSRYYDDGDFMSLRRYGKGAAGGAETYAVPYDGSEVVLHWTNKDQYYIKTSENFSNYSFNPRQALEKDATGISKNLFDDASGATLKVHFRVVEATPDAHNNAKASAKDDRFFLIDKDQPIAWEGSELVIRFQYRVDPDKPTRSQKGKWQSDRNDEIVTVVLDALSKTEGVDVKELAAEYASVLARDIPKGKDKRQALLGRYLGQYTASNTMDFFIHKELGEFLHRELDFYLKNEVLKLDDFVGSEDSDVQSGGMSVAKMKAVQTALEKAQAIRLLAQRLIDFLSQLEEFQKRLWLKKKFVVETNYCITIDRIPEKFYPEIAANDEQRKEWVRWFAIDEIQQDTATIGYSVPLTTDFLKGNGFLVLDTKHFNADFQARLISEFDGFSDSLGGTIIHSENFNALNLLEGIHKNGVKLVLTDPPYNTKTDVFPYKDSYKHSSWLTMMSNRMERAKNLLREDGAYFHHIDENEHQNATMLLTEIFGSSNRVVDIVWKNSSKNGESFISMQHEYIVGAVKNSSANKGEWLERKEGLEEIYKAFEGFRRKHGTDWKAIHQAALDFYNSFPDSNPIKDSSHYSWMDEKGIYFPDNISKPANGYYYELEHPTTKRPCKKPAGGWRFIEETMLDKVSKNEIHFGDDETTVPNNKTYLKNTENQGLTSIKYKDGRVASNLLKDMFGEKDPFKNPKDVELTSRLLKALDTENEVVVDYFAGSGTTIHAILELERAGQKRRYEAIEMGDHFDNVLIPRVKKAIYSVDWKDGKPVSRKGISHAFKYLRLESYEDCLNNLALNSVGQATTSQADTGFQRDYLLQYMLQVETQGSNSLLNFAEFRDPPNYSLEIKKPGSDVREKRTIDLIETFNYLIGLRVDKLHAGRRVTATFSRKPDPLLPEDATTRLVADALTDDATGPWWFRPVEGYIQSIPGDSRQRQNVLVLWRSLTDDPEEDAAVLEAFMAQRMRFNPTRRADKALYDIIYINGTHNLPNLGKYGEVRLLEEEFHRRMWIGG
jgi:adenine-specific DNA-methyltransferase